MLLFDPFRVGFQTVLDQTIGIGLAVVSGARSSHYIFTAAY